MGHAYESQTNLTLSLPLPSTRQTTLCRLFIPDLIRSGWGLDDIIVLMLTARNSVAQDKCLPKVCSEMAWVREHACLYIDKHTPTRTHVLAQLTLQENTGTSMCVR